MANKQIIIPINLSDTYFDKGVNTVNKIEYKLSYTIASLKTSISQPGIVMITDTGKEGLFKYDSTDTTSVNNDISIIVDVSNKRWKRVSDIANTNLPLAGGTIAGTLSVNSFLGVGGNIGITAGQYISSKDNGGTYRNMLGYDGGSNFYVGDVSNAVVGSQVVHSANAVQSFYTNGIERTRITQAGNIGIGNSNPLYKLDILGNARITDATNTGNLYLGDGTINKSPGSPFMLVGGIVTDDIQTRSYSTNSYNVNGIGSITNGLKFTLASNLSTNTTSLASGVVPHNTNAVFNRPTFASTNLGVVNTLASNVYIDGAPIAGTNTTITNTFALYVNSGNSYFGGNVGIGTTNPSKNLTLASSNATTFRLESTNSPLAYFTEINNLYDGAEPFNINVAGTKLLAIKSIGVGTAGEQTAILNNYSSLALSTGAINPTLSSIRLLINSVGNVGIGNTVPNYKLDVTGAVRSDKLIVGNTVDNGNILQVTGISSLMGNVGIGIIAPTTKLHIASAFNNGITLTNGTNSGQIFNDGNMHVESTGYLWLNSNNTSLTSIGAGGGNTYINSNIGNVGIGNTAPVTKLDISGTAHISDGVGTRIRLRTGGIIDFATIGQGSYADGTVMANNLSLFGNNGTGMYVNSSGNILINSNTDNGNKLQVNGGATVTTLQVGTPFPTYAPFNVSQDGGYPYSGIFAHPLSTINKRAIIGIYGAENAMGIQASYHSTGNYVPFVINPSGGNVGIGTTAPIASLDVRNGKIITGTASSVNGTTVLESYYNQDGINGALSTLGTNYSSGGWIIGYGINSKVGFTNSFTSSTPLALPRSSITQDGDFKFLSATAQTVAIGTDIALTEKFRITNAGNVGIGTTTPLSPLHVAGINPLTWNPTITANTILGIGGVAGSSFFVNTPSLNSSYHSGLGVDGLYTNPGGIGTSVVNIKSLGVNSGGGYDSNLAFWTSLGISSTEKMRILSNGNVGIGTTTPNAKVEIFNGSLLVNVPRTATGTIIPIAVGTQRYTGLANSGLAGMYHVESGTSGFGQAGSLAFYTSADDVAGTEKLRITNVGNVGIGTIAPISPFHVKLATNQNIFFAANQNGGETGTAGIISINDVNSAYAPLGFYASKYNFGGGNLIVGSNTDNGNKLQITGNASISGNLGVGGTGLVINTAGNAYASITYIDNQTSGNTWLSGPGVGTGQPNGFSLLYNTNTIGTIIYAKNDGKVGIGTTTPLAKLEVGGSFSQTTPQVSARNVGTSFEFGHPNQAGYASTLGADPSSGSPSLTFNSEVSTTTANTFRTRGLLGRTITNDLIGQNLNFQRIVAINADSQAPVIDMTISNSGRIGIGTTTPVTNLDVVGGVNASSAYYVAGTQFATNAGLNTVNINARVISNSNGTGGFTDGLFLGYNNSAGGSTRIYDGGTTNSIIVNNGAVVTNGITKFLFGNQTDNGNFAQFSGTVGFKSNVYLGTTLVQNNNGFQNWKDPSGVERRMLGLSSTNFYVGDVDNTIVGSQTLFATNTNHLFYINGLEKARFIQNGNFGLNITAPRLKMEISATAIVPTALSVVTADGNLLLSDGGNLGVVHGISNYNSTYQGYVQARNNTASSIAYNYLINPLGGNVGIGTTNASLPLTINADNNDVGQVLISGKTDPTRNLFLGYNTTGNYGVIQAVTQGVAYNTLALNPTGGGVSVGTSSSLGKFHVKLGTNQNIVYSPNLQGVETGTPAIVALNDANSGYTPLGFYASKYSVLGGNMIISTASVADNGSKLQVNGSATIAGSISAASSITATTGLNILGAGAYNAASKVGIDYNNGASRFYSSGANTTTKGAFEFHTNSSDGLIDNIALAISNVGNVGIGTTNPSARLQITPTSGVTSFAINGNAATVFIDYLGTGNNYIDGSVNIWRNFGGVEKLRLDTGTGYLGIGTSTPAATLDVNGSTRLMGSVTGNVRIITGVGGTYAITATDYVVILLANPGSTYTVDIASASNIGRQLHLVNKVAGNQTLSQNFVNLAGVSTNQLLANSSTKLIYDGTTLQQF